MVVGRLDSSWCSNLHRTAVVARAYGFLWSLFHRATVLSDVKPYVMCINSTTIVNFLSVRVISRFGNVACRSRSSSRPPKEKVPVVKV